MDASLGYTSKPYKTFVLNRFLRGMEYDGFYTMRVLGAAGAT